MSETLHRGLPGVGGTLDWPDGLGQGQSLRVGLVTLQRQQLSEGVPEVEQVAVHTMGDKLADWGVVCT